MEWDKIYSRILKKEDVPKKGYMLAYTRKEVIFRKYDSVEDLNTIFRETAQKENQSYEKALPQEILEIHLFDKEKEYRAIASESKRNISGDSTNGHQETAYSGGIRDEELGGIENVAGIGWKKEDIYKEKVMLEPAFVKQVNGITNKSVTVYNHIFYEDGIAKIDDYRLVMEG